MARTPLAHWVTRTVRDLEIASDPTLGHELLRDTRGSAGIDGDATNGLTRRSLLRGGAALALAVTGMRTLGPALAATREASGPRIVVVGAGLAGLTCAYRLKGAGFRAQVHEAAERVGGRCWTIRGFFDDGQIAEHGGEFIDSSHVETRRLAHELGLHLDDVLAAQAPGTELTSLFQGHRYTEAQATADIRAAWPTWRDDTNAAGYPTTYRSFTRRGLELDRTTLAEYLDATVPGGRRSRLGQMLDIVYTIEYGADTDRQSALNFLYLIGFARQRQLKLVGTSDERFHVRGGNDQMADRLARRLDGQITLGSALVAIEERPDGRFRLAFDRGRSTRTILADKVVLTVPFAVLRSSVDLSKAGFKARKRMAIAELGMGTNSKLHLQFASRRWRHLGWTGETYSSRGYQSTWEVTRAQPGAVGILVDYTGGTIGASFGEGSPDERARRFLRQVEPVVPGLTDRWNGKATVDFWLGDPWTRGSYSYWQVGQYTRFAGVEREHEGNCHFAGEHTSLDSQGYLNGAVSTGEWAARQVAGSLARSRSRARAG